MRAISIDGVEVDAGAASVPVLDRGFLYGDSAFEVLRTYGGVPFAVGPHIRRLRESCGRLGIPLAVDDETLAREVDATLEAANNPESYVRLIVTRGVTAIGLRPSGQLRARRVIVCLPLPEQPADLYTAGRAVATVTGARALDGTGAAGAKASNYLPNILALETAQARGAYEAISVAAGGEVLEGSTSNLFVVRGGALSTPPLVMGILGGITRRVVIDAAADLGVPFSERLLFASELYRVDEAFITSSLREVVPVTAVDGVLLGDGTPGRLTRRLHAAFSSRVHAMLPG